MLAKYESLIMTHFYKLITKEYVNNTEEMSQAIRKMQNKINSASQARLTEIIVVYFRFSVSGLCYSQLTQLKRDRETIGDI